MNQEVEMCKFYTTSAGGRPFCTRVPISGLMKAGLRCHLEREDCAGYKPSVSHYEEVKS